MVFQHSYFRVGFSNGSCRKALCMASVTSQMTNHSFLDWWLTSCLCCRLPSGGYFELVAVHPVVELIPLTAAAEVETSYQRCCRVFYLALVPAVSSESNAYQTNLPKLSPFSAPLCALRRCWETLTQLEFLVSPLLLPRALPVPLQQDEVPP